MHRVPRRRARVALRFTLGAALAAALLSAPLVEGPAGTWLAGETSEVTDEAAFIAPELRLEVRETGEVAAATPAQDLAPLRNIAILPQTGERAATARIEVMVYFADAGVTAPAQGEPELAAAALQEQADAHWARVDAQLGELERSGDVQVLNRFWATSALLVSAAGDERTLAALAALPGATALTPNYEIEGLATDQPTPASEPSVPATRTASVAESDAASSANALDAADAADVTDETETPITYGLERIRADEAWRDFGATGQGVRVAVLDTGVDATHPDIAARLVGRGTGDPSYPGGWINFDRNGNPIVSKPTDPGSHGTHVAGTIVGGAASGTQIGVAPGAELMAANVLSGGGSSAKILRALEWVMEPFDGEGKPAGRAADVINMSLGSGAYDASLIQPLRNLRDAGIFPAIAIGNAPCGPNGTSSPGDIYEAFGVGMTNAADEVDPGSCGAVTNWPAATAERYGWPTNFVKPNASAPGARVFSAMPGGRWGEATGTSMATPHVAGAVALLRSAQGGLSVAQLEDALESTAWHPTPNTGPDTGYGHGRIDVHAAIASVLGASGITGTVRDAASGAPVAGAEVSYGDRGETWTTDAQGRFTARLAPGQYTLSVTRFGFTPSTGTTVTVAADRFTSLDLPLQAITTGSLVGIAVSHADGKPLAGATIHVLGHELTAETAADGSYRFDGIPVGAYRVRADAEGMSAATSAPAEVRAALATTVNFRLAALPRVLVLGDNAGRTAELIAANGFTVERAETLPDNLGTPGAYDSVLWDRATQPGGAPLSSAQVQSAIEATDASGTGIVWLDLGDDDSHGIADYLRAAGDPATRGSDNDRSVTATGYRVTAEHPIFAGGELSAEPLAVGSVLRQNTASGGPKFVAWFAGLTGTAPKTLGETVVIRGEDDRASGSRAEVESVGDGIAVDERAKNRHAFLALHGSSSAIDARTWSLASSQLLVNSLKWVSPVSAQAPEPEIVLPKPPVVTPGDGGDRPSVTPSPATPTATAAPSASRAPSAQAAQKPETAPQAPVSEYNQLVRGNAGDVTLRLEGGIAHLKVPGAKPGDWFYLHVYPGAIGVDWIRVNDDGELRIDTAKLPGGDYRFALTRADGSFAGWVGLKIAGARSGASSTSSPAEATDAASTQSTAAPTTGFTLSTPEQLMLLGAALILLAAAGIVIFAGRRSSGDGPLEQADTLGTADSSGAPR